MIHMTVKIPIMNRVAIVVQGKHKIFKSILNFLKFSLMYNRRYRDNDRSNSPSTSDNNIVKSAPTFKSDDKKPISVKAPVKSFTGAPSSSSTVNKPPPKRIDLGAASNYGKSSDLGINSPTHRNTHSEDLFGNEEKNSNDIENIFDNDDFNPRAGEKKEVAPDFGDFESAFGKSTSSGISLPSASSSSNDFADFSSAFSPSSTATTASSKPQALDDNFLFNSPPLQSTTVGGTILSNDLNADLFGNNVIATAFTSQQSSTTTKNDLLDDFADLRINAPVNQGEFFLL